MAPIVASVARSSMPEMPNPRPQPNPRPSPRPTPRAPASSTEQQQRRTSPRPYPEAVAPPRRGRARPRPAPRPARPPAPPDTPRDRARPAPRPRPRPLPRARGQAPPASAPRSTRRDDDGGSSFVPRRAGNASPRHRGHPGAPTPMVEPSVDPPGGAEPPARPAPLAVSPQLEVGRIRDPLSVLTILALAFVGLGWRSYRKIERVAVKSALTEHIERRNELPHRRFRTLAKASPGTIPTQKSSVRTPAPARTDTIVVLHVGPDGNLMLPLPRDLFIPIVGGKGRDRINTAIQHGPESLIQTVQQSLGIPVHHYVEMDFVGFLELVDAVGGVEYRLRRPGHRRTAGSTSRPPGRTSSTAIRRSRTCARGTTPASSTARRSSTRPPTSAASSASRSSSGRSCPRSATPAIR